MITPKNEGKRLEPIKQLAEDLGLARGLADVLIVLRQLSLAAADDIAGVLGRSPHGVHKHLGLLREQHLVDSDQLGWTRKQRQRWFLDKECLQGAGLSGDTWHEEHARCRLVELLAALEQFYRTVGDIKQLGSFEEFQWLDALDQAGPGCDAAVRFEAGWVSLFWCGFLLSETHLAKRLLRLPEDFQSLAVGDPQPWPSFLCLVVADQWQREIAIRVLEDYGLERRAMLRCIADDTVTGPAEVARSRGWLYQPLKRRDAERVSWVRTLEKSPWAGAGGQEAGRVLASVVQWPGCGLPFIKGLLAEGRGQSRASDAGRVLVGRKLLRREGKGRKQRFVPAASGLFLHAQQDRVHATDARMRTGLSQLPEGVDRDLRHTLSQPHENGLRALLLPFAEAGCPIANGVRHTELLGSDGGIATDAVVRLNKSPWGRTWAYVEYERSARYKARISKKLRGYGSPRRRDRYPVILVCWSAPEEEKFQAKARRLGIPMVTTTLERLKEFGPLGNADCWSLDGEATEIG